MIEPFISPIKKFIYPKIGEEFTIRLMGALHPYYRMYLNPNQRWYEITDAKQMKKCILGDIEATLDIAQSLLSKSPTLAKDYEIDRVKKSIVPVPTKIMVWHKPDPYNASDNDRISFLRSFLDGNMASIWSTCIITNAYVKEGVRYKRTLQPLVITKSMFFNMVSSHVPLKGAQELGATSLSGINAYDLILAREKKAYSDDYKIPVVLRTLDAPCLLTHDELSSIVKQKLLDIDAFVKFNNNQVIDALGGFIYRPYKGMKDAIATLKILQDMEDMEQDEQYAVTEKELCNIPPELANESAFENGPISGLEIV